MTGPEARDPAAGASGADADALAAPRELPRLTQRQRVLLILKLLAVPLGVGLAVDWLLGSAEQQDRAANLWLILLSLAINRATVAVAALRLKATLAAFAVHLPWSDAHRIHLQSMFYYVVVPMQVGLEISRFFKVRAVAIGVTTPRLLLALLADRAVGMSAAVGIALATLPFVTLRAERGIALDRDALLVAGAIAAAGCAAALAVPRIRRLLLRIWEATAGRRGFLLASGLLSIVIMLGWTGAIYVATLGLGIETAPVAFLFGSMAGVLGTVVPLSLIGAGPGEAAAVAAFVLLGVEQQAAVVIALVGYLAKLVTAIEGGVWEIAGDARRMIAGRR
ncbi:MAG: flippase-like domain-containing protein [Alphaproteobacteria bacterium]|nr:flippase-like domain-containing protein [Alphaproteobacteria bacterium]